jgi:two-component system, chemotaxis family, sensor kinase CheA
MSAGTIRRRILTHYGIDMTEIVREFLLETHENLAQLDLDLVTLERDPTEKDTLSRVFRTLHTVKGTAGFLGLPKLQAVAHAAENLLSRLRDGELRFSPEIASSLLATVDAIRRMLDSLEKTDTEGAEDDSALVFLLGQLTKGISVSTPAESTSFSISTPASPPAAKPVTPPPSPAPTIAATIAVERPSPPPTPSPQQAVSITPPPVAAVEAGEQRQASVSDSAIRVDVGLLDKLMTLVGELVLARNQIVQFSSSQEDSAYLNTVGRLNQLTTELQTSVMKTRMQPIGNVWSKFPRVVRDLAVACAKQVRLEMEGQETELDKTILEAIRDPLTHLVRNAIDHGIELPAERTALGKSPEGRLRLHAFHEGGKVIIEISDDGRGIDSNRVREKAIRNGLIAADHAGRMSEQQILELIFLPGFSTAERVTQFSGRGVGMDVVRTHIEKIGGMVEIDSRLGSGTTIKMKIPLTLAIIPALTITSGGDRYAIPQVSLLELVRLERDSAQRGIELIQGYPVYRLRGNLLPLVYLDRELNVESALDRSHDFTDVNIVVLQADDRQFGLIVDAIHDTEEIVVKPLQKQLKGINVFSGATIMGDGKVALILDVLGLAQRAHVLTGASERTHTEKTKEGAATENHRAILLFTTGAGGRMAVPLDQVARLEEFPKEKLERVGPRIVVQYRGEILPLIDVARALQREKRSNRGRSNNSAALESVQVVVFSGSGFRVGLIVGQIIDIVEESAIAQAPASRPGVLFNSVIQGRVTEFLDIEAIIRTVDPGLLATTEAAGGGA